MVLVKSLVQADWSKTTLPHNIGQNPAVMDPHERKSVFVKTSLIPGSNEGLFARRAFSPGEIVSYFSGQRTFSSVMFHDNMTEKEEWVTSEYYFNLEYNSPAWWEYPQVSWIPLIQPSYVQSWCLPVYHHQPPTNYLSKRVFKRPYI